MALPTLGGIARESGKRVGSAVADPIKATARAAVQPITNFTNPIAEFLKDAAGGDKKDVGDAIKKTSKVSSVSNDKLDRLIDLAKQQVNLLQKLYDSQTAAAKLRAREAAVKRSAGAKVLEVDQDDSETSARSSFLKGLLGLAAVLGTTAFVKNLPKIKKSLTKFFKGLKSALEVIGTLAVGALAGMLLTFNWSRFIRNFKRKMLVYFLTLKKNLTLTLASLKAVAIGTATNPIVLAAVGLTTAFFGMKKLLELLAEKLNFDSAGEMVMYSIFKIKDGLAAFSNMLLGLVQGIANLARDVAGFIPERFQTDTLKEFAQGETEIKRFKTNSAEEYLAAKEAERTRNKVIGDSNKAAADAKAMQADTNTAVAASIPSSDAVKVSGPIDRKSEEYKAIYNNTTGSNDFKRQYADFVYRQKQAEKVRNQKQTGADVGQASTATMSNVNIINNVNNITNNTNGQQNIQNIAAARGAPGGLNTTSN